MVRDNKIKIEADAPKLKSMYVEYLYSKERMSYKLAAFEKITLPSVLSNLETKDSAEWWLFISKELPIEYKEKLHELVCGSVQVKIIELDTYADYSKAYTLKYDSLSVENERLCSLRIDDDDGVYSSLLDDIEVAAQSRDYPFLYSCPLGRYCKLDADGTIILGKQIVQTTWPHTVALAGIDVDIRKLGDHTKIQKRNPNLEIVKNLEKKDAVLITCDPKHTATLRSF
jgi:hypothetical protein